MSNRLIVLLLVAFVLAWLTWSSKREIPPEVLSRHKSSIKNLEDQSNKLNSDENALHQTQLLIPRKSLIQDSNVKDIREDLFNTTQTEAKPVNATPQPPVTLQVESPVQFHFSYLGKKYEDGHWTVFLSNQGKTLLASDASILEGDFKVTKLQPPVMEITHLPSKQTQTISIGSVD